MTAYALCAACTGSGVVVPAGFHAADGGTRTVTAYCPRCGGSGVEPEGEK